VWYYNAAYETAPELSLKAGNERAFQGLITCYEAMGLPEQADAYREEAMRRGQEGQSKSERSLTSS
ncbi:MAG: hypothetical protein K2O57_04815, partial [Acetatifactor sp.]|nr:hypothetical protein [Acetatifactor sp.]